MAEARENSVDGEEALSSDLYTANNRDMPTRGISVSGKAVSETSLAKAIRRLQKRK